MKRIMFVVVALVMAFPSYVLAAECTEVTDCNIQLLQMENQLIQTSFELGVYKSRELAMANQAKIADLTKEQEAAAEEAEEVTEE